MAVAPRAAGAAHAQTLKPGLWQITHDTQGSGEMAQAKSAPKRDPKAVPVFVPLDNFTVNLADREAERYAQIGISLELNDAKAGEEEGRRAMENLGAHHPHRSQ